MHLHPSILFLLVLCSLRNVLLISGQSQLPVPHEARRAPILDNAFDAWIQETGKSWGMKGLAIAVVRKDEQNSGWTTETKGYGIADRWGNPADEETRFSIGSNSKLFTALAVGLLVSNKSLSIDWNTKIKDILPHSVWGLDDKVAQDHANLVDILSHQTGLPGHQGSYSRGESVESFLSKQRYLRQSAEFRETFQYNNQMYTLAAHIISRLTDTPFATYIMRNVISPLGMISTTYDVSHAQKSGKLADGFVNAEKNQGKGKGPRNVWFRPIPYWNHESGRELVAGPGGVISTAKDMATWLQALLLPNDSVMPTSIVEKVARGVSVATPKALFPELSPILYGMGQERYAYQGHELIEHNGGTPGYYSVVTRSPQDGLGIAVLTNWEAGSIFMETVKWKILEKALGLEEVNWNERYHKIADEIEGDLAQQSRAPPEADPPTVATFDVAGIYFNPAYGTLFFCAYPPPKYLQPLSKECDDLIWDARTSLRSFLNDSVPTLLATSPHIGITHVALQHISGDQYKAFALNAYPAPFPALTEPDDDHARPFAVVDASWPANLVLRKGLEGFVENIEGMAWTGGIWGAGAGVKSPKGDGREGAEVWFDRVA